MEITIKELTTKEEMLSTHFLVSQMYEKITKEDFSEMLDEMILRNNYKIVAAIQDEKIVGISGYWISLMLYCGRYLQVSNIVVDSKMRKSGIGKKMLDYLQIKAKEARCEKIVLDSYVLNTKSHPLFFREGFYIRGFHFMKDL
jgi:N-acetylglutamate synthase-like GNAT family acetyltransferase